MKNGSVSVGVKIAIEGMIGELRCSHLKNNKDMKLFEQRVITQVEQQVEHATKFLKTKRSTHSELAIRFTGKIRSCGNN